MKLEKDNEISITLQKEENPENKNLLVTGHCEKKNSANIISWKSALAQSFGSGSVCLASMSIGMMLAFPTIAIGELHKSNQDFSISDAEASWVGSLLYLLQPICSIFGGIIQPYIGRKYGIILTFLPQLLSWILLPFAQSVLTLYLAMILFGISTGSMEAPGLAYIGEITQPRIRSIFTCSMSIFFSLGNLFIFLLGSLFSWRTIAAISVSVPAISIAAICFIPESPIWLLNKGREEDALKSLCWLRGWVSPEYVKLEFESMCHYIKVSKYSDYCSNNAEPKNSLWQKFKGTITILNDPTVRQPFFLISVGHFACHSSTLTGMRSYLIDILRSMQIPVKPQLFTFTYSILMICGAVMSILGIKSMGKRFMILISLMSCSFMCLLLSWYTFYMDRTQFIWIPAISILIIHLAMTFGLLSVPWMLTSEVFPLKGRAMGTGLVAATYYVIGFLFSKTFHSLNEIIHLQGCFLLYGLFGLLSFVYLYLKMPETEGKTLAEIEEYFSARSRQSKNGI